MIGSRRVVGWAAALAAAALAAGCGSKAGGWKPGDPLTIDVSGAFPAGAAVHDAYSDARTTVSASGTVTVTPGPEGVVLLARDGAAATPFQWKDATVYFAMTDRFANGDPSNDGSYGRTRDGAQEVGTWHGGDWKGLAAKLDYVASLGATALWISPVVEQVHGWAAGGTGDFKHYGYHGYWALDFTRLDESFGTEADLQALVDGAHARGIRVLADVVMNHPGYATGDDLVAYLPTVFADGTGAAFQAFEASGPGPGQNWGTWNSFVNYASPDWVHWWSPTWIRAGFPGFTTCGTGGGPACTDQTQQLSYLPDFITEGTAVAGVPDLFVRKAAIAPPVGGTNVVDLPNGTVRDYLVKWHTDWVRRFGFDGFRCDTAKNVELASWKALKDGATAALADWKAANPTKKLDDAPFWMVGEVFPHGPTMDSYFTDGGFDALLNFDFQKLVGNLLAAEPLVDGADQLDGIYSGYAENLTTPGFDFVSYLSSHDTRLFYAIVGDDPERQREGGTALLLAPGAAQLFYGDESGRLPGPSASDPVQGTRSDMNWGTTDASILDHFRKLGAFRGRHAAVGAGAHARIASPAGTYAFSRTLASPADAVVVVLARPR